MAKGFYFHYQVEGKESKWELAAAAERTEIIQAKRPAFSTVLDLSTVPDDNDWTKVRYRGPFYADFDADGDLPLVCDQFSVFLGKLDAELDFDVTQAYIFATGGKGFHIEIPAACFQPKVPEQGTTWLPYIYRAMAEQHMVDTLDLNVYTGKRGRQWRTPNRQRENGNYKVPLTLDEALSMTPELYTELIKAPREVEAPTPATNNNRFSMLFERSKEKVQGQMRGKKKRQEKSNAILDPWRKAQRTPPSIEKLMAGDELADGVGFQSIAMQLSIYASSVGLDVDNFIDRCQGLVQNHVSDSARYSSPDRRRNELRRMFEYMVENTLYDFDAGPIARLLKAGTDVTDLGVVTSDDEAPEAQTHVNDDGEVVVQGPDLHRGLQKQVVVTTSGIFLRKEGGMESLCKATFLELESFHDAEDGDFKGFAFNLGTGSGKPKPQMVTHDIFTSSAKMKQFMLANRLTYQGGDAETVALMDILSARADRAKRKVYTYPREGLFLLDHPDEERSEPIPVYLTRDVYMSGMDETDPSYFRLKYKPNMALSSYNIDIDKAPDLSEKHIQPIRDLFEISKASVIADLVGWFVACHYRAFYLRVAKQFPLLQIYGEAGAGKSQTVMLLARLHWNQDDRVSLKSAVSCTPFALDMHASTSTSAPLILDEYKPREMRMQRGKHEKLKDVMKASYIGADIGERGTLNRGGENGLAVIKSKATAPIVFMGESAEMETAIVERCVTVQLSKAMTNSKRRREAFYRLQANPEALSALGRELVELGFSIDLAGMKDEINAVKARIEKSLPDLDDTSRRRVSERMLYNRVVIVHALSMLQRVLAKHFGTEFDEILDNLQNLRSTMDSPEDERVIQISSMSEISKVMSRIALLSRATGRDFEVAFSKDYLIGPGWVELKVERAYDCYRRYCASIHETPLFDNLESFLQALGAYSPVIDGRCDLSDLRDGSSESIIRMDTNALIVEGVQQFRI